MTDRPTAIEGYYVESTEGLLFAVKGLVHPPGALIAYLRYAPQAPGDRERNGVRYRRLYRFVDQERFLREKHPLYLFFDPVFGEQLQGVLNERIGLIYEPCSRLAELRRRRKLDPRQATAVEFADLLVRRAKVPQTSVGISGSLLVGLHTPRSDLDVVVYGSEQCQAVHSALWDLLDESVGQVSRLDAEEMRQLYSSRSQDTPMSFEDFARLEGRKVSQGRFRGCEYFIRFVKAPAEVSESYGDRRYTSLGPAQIEAVVADAGEAILTPCTYKIDEARFVKPQQTETPPLDIVSFRGRFCEQARVGARVVAKGKLERVDTRQGESYHRLLLGGPGDFLTAKAG